MRRSRATWGAAALILGGLATWTPPAGGSAPCREIPIGKTLPAAGVALRRAEAFDVRPGRQMYLQAALFPSPGEVVTRPAGPDAPRGARPTPVSVHYDGFPPEAQAAFQHAVDVWTAHIASPVPLTIEASFAPLDAGILGSASPAVFVRDRDGTTPWYPVALAEALLGRPLLPGSPDIVARFNEDANLWYFGVDGRPPPGKYDFTSVVLHELGHGLGLTGDFGYDGGIGSWGRGLADGIPTVFDSLVADAHGRFLTETYANESTELGSQLVGGTLVFGGPAARGATGGAGPPLFVPATWTDGTSLYHLDPALSGPGTPDALMSPTLGRGVAVADAGPVVDAVLRDLGWPAALPGPPVELAVAGGEGDGAVTVTWRPPAETGSSAISGYVLTFAPPGGPPVEVSVPDSPAVVSGLDDGTVYDVRVAAVNSSGRGAFSGGKPVAVVARATPTTTPAEPAMAAAASPPPAVPALSPPIPSPPAASDAAASDPANPPPPSVPAPVAPPSGPGSHHPEEDGGSTPTSPPAAMEPCPTATPRPRPESPRPESSPGAELASSPVRVAGTRGVGSGAENYLGWGAAIGTGLLVAGETTRRRARPRVR